MSRILVKKRSGEFVKVSQAEADKLVEDGHAVLYDLKTSRHEPFKPYKLEKIKPVIKKGKKKPAK